jgi:hypothetical protein
MVGCIIIREKLMINGAISNKYRFVLVPIWSIRLYVALRERHAQNFGFQLAFDFAGSPYR